MTRRCVPLDPASKRAVWAKPESNAGLGWHSGRSGFRDGAASEDFEAPQDSDSDDPLPVDAFIRRRDQRG